MAQLRSEGRVLPVEPLPDKPVHRAWDLGVGDDTSIWWFQAVGAQLFILDHYAASGVGLEHYRDVLERRHDERGWKHGDDYVPHDAKIKEWGSGRTRVETMQGMGLKPMLVPWLRSTGINAVQDAGAVRVSSPLRGGGIDALGSTGASGTMTRRRSAPAPCMTDLAPGCVRYLALSWRRRRCGGQGAPDRRAGSFRRRRSRAGIRL
jgi:hypothetical protein